jgi:hypothetical protein
VAVAVHSCTTRSVAHVEPPRAERDVGPGREDAADVLERLAPSARSPAVWFSNTMSGACSATIASTSWAFQAAL